MSTKPRVLIVDDEPDVVANWARLLGREDYTCITTTEGAQALTLLATERPDIVLTDLKMPVVGGDADPEPGPSRWIPTSS